MDILYSLTQSLYNEHDVNNEEIEAASTLMYMKNQNKIGTFYTEKLGAKKDTLSLGGSFELQTNGSFFQRAAKRPRLQETSSAKQSREKIAKYNYRQTSTMTSPGGLQPNNWTLIHGWFLTILVRFFHKTLKRDTTTDWIINTYHRAHAVETQLLFNEGRAKFLISRNNDDSCLVWITKQVAALILLKHALESIYPENKLFAIVRDSFFLNTERPHKRFKHCGNVYEHHTQCGQVS